MTSLHVICGLGLPQSKIPATPINWKLPEKLFWRPFVLKNTCGCIFGPWPWPRAFLSWKRLFFASDFFCVLGLGLEPCVLDSTSAYDMQINHFFLSTFTVFLNLITLVLDIPYFCWSYVLQWGTYCPFTIVHIFCQFCILMQMSLKPHLHGRLFCVRFFDKNGTGKVAFTQRRFWSW